MNKLIQAISLKTSLDPELTAAIPVSFEFLKARKGENLLLEDQRAMYLYFVEKGIVHNYYFQEDRKVTSWFYAENQFITAWYSFYSQQPSFEEIECLEDCELYRISHSDYQKLIMQFPAFAIFARLLAEEMVGFLDHFSKGWSFLSAKEKYKLLKSYFPDVELRVKLGYIASFLGITQETFSRIRAER